MEQRIWSKTILNIYRYLDKSIKIIDDTVYRLSLIPSLPSRNITQKLLEFTQRKIWFINLKLIVEKALSECKEKNIKVLSLRYINDMSIPELALYFGKSERTIFRQINSATCEFESNLLKNGHSANYFFHHFKNEKWIIKEYKKQYEFEVMLDEKRKPKKQKDKDVITIKEVSAFNMFKKSI